MLYAVIMAGGKGERFWPLSRKDNPKQLLKFFKEKTLLELTIDRVSELVPKERVVIVTNIDQAERIQELLPDIPKKNIIAEPMGRNTAPCIGLAAQFIFSNDPDGIMIVLPADHIIDGQANFIRNLKDASDVAADSDNLVTFGIKPHGPETGYGYIKKGEYVKQEKKTVFSLVKGFYEKPDIDTAQKYFESGEYLWNSGMFVWRCDVILEKIKQYLPGIYKQISAMELSFKKPVDRGALMKAYESMKAISIDYGVMERAKNVLVASSDFGWDDVGSWCALERHSHKDKNGNVVLGDMLSIETRNCIINGKGKLIAAVGIRDLIIVDTPDALLICHKDLDQDVKKIVERLKAEGKYTKYL